MASESDMRDPSSLIERLINSRNRDLSMLLPVILGFTSSTDEGVNRGGRDRIILINPMTQGMVVIEGSSAGLDSLIRDLMSKGGQPPATKASIESMPSVVIGECGGECAICLDEWLEGEVVKEMPCKHKFHGNCVEKWLKLHGSCPVCRFKMPSDDPVKKFGSEERDSGNSNSNSRREIWLSFSVNNGRRSGESESSDDSDNSGSDDQSED